MHDRLVGCTDPDGVRWVYAYDPFGRRLSKQRRFGEQELIYVRARWPELVADQPDLPERGSHYLREIAPGGHQPGDKAPPVTGTFYMWDGDQMVQEAPLRLDGTIDETSAIRWHYEEGDHTPLAKQLPSGELHYIITDHLGTPKEMFDEAGNLVWSASHYAWGAVRAAKMYGNLALKQEPEPNKTLCPFRFPGQYEDVETGLYYNRHRYYDALTGQYCSPDPIGLAGGDRPQGYVDRPGSWVDPLGLKAEQKLLAPPTGSNPWPEGVPLKSYPAPKGGIDVEMAMSPGQTKPGGWSTRDTITDVITVRKRLAVIPKFKKEISHSQKFKIPEGVQVQEGLVGPQMSNGVLYPGGGNQVQILNFADRAKLIPIGPPTPIY